MSENQTNTVADKFKFELECIREYFDACCSGYQNVKPIDTILVELDQLMGVHLNRNRFQNFHLQSLRRENFPICPSRKGLYLAKTLMDFDRGIAWFQERIAAEERAKAELLALREAFEKPFVTTELPGQPRCPKEFHPNHVCDATCNYVTP